MKKIIIVLSILFSLKVSASIPLITWECEDIKVTFNDDNTMTVGNLVYTIDFYGRTMYLCHGDMEMFQVINNSSGGLIFNYTINGKKHSKHFIMSM